MQFPPYLVPGDRIALVAPSRWVDSSLVESCVARIASCGLEAVVPDGLLAKDGQLAGSDDHRASIFIKAWNDTSVKALWALRGGYGAQRILERIDRGIHDGRASWFAGFSDSTAIHGLLQQRGICSLHAPVMSTGLGEQEGGLVAALDYLQGKSDSLSLSAPAHPLNVMGEAKGRLVGGNLSVIQTMMGTPSFPIHEGDILFLEDIDEMLYHVDRMMVQLVRSGSLSRLAAICIGGMTDMRDNTRAFGFSVDNPFGKSAAEIIHEHVSPLRIPLAFDLPAGHGKDNEPLVLGSHMQLHVDKAGTRLAHLQ